jgi:hypothetical protein
MLPSPSSHAPDGDEVFVRLLDRETAELEGFVVTRLSKEHKAPILYAALCARLEGDGHTELAERLKPMLVAAGGPRSNP